jgi:hypothetical protein
MVCCLASIHKPSGPAQIHPPLWTLPLQWAKRRSDPLEPTSHLRLSHGQAPLMVDVLLQMHLMDCFERVERSTVSCVTEKSFAL